MIPQDSDSSTRLSELESSLKKAAEKNRMATGLQVRMQDVISKYQQLNAMIRMLTDDAFESYLLADLLALHCEVRAAESGVMVDLAKSMSVALSGYLQERKPDDRPNSSTERPSAEERGGVLEPPPYLPGARWMTVDMGDVGEGGGEREERAVSKAYDVLRERARNLQGTAKEITSELDITGK